MSGIVKALVHGASNANGGRFPTVLPWSIAARRPAGEIFYRLTRIVICLKLTYDQRLSSPRVPNLPLHFLRNTRQRVFP